VRATASLAALCLAALAAGQEPVASFGSLTVIPGGLRGLVYHISANTLRLPNFRKLKPVGRIYVSSLNVPPQNFKKGFPGVTKRYEWFAIDYTGRLWIDKPGVYNFVLTSDDGARLYIDDQLVLDDDGLHPPTEVSGDVDLSPGIHNLRVPYFQGPRTAVALVLQVAPPGESLRVFNTDDFKPPLHPETWPPDPGGNRPPNK
jgi:hypothetical protein